MQHDDHREAWSHAQFKEALLAKQSAYHNHHPFHLAMSAGHCSKEQMQGWVANRYYYQASLPMKDAAILANCPDRSVRQEWCKRLINADGMAGEAGGLDEWLDLAAACGLERAAVLDFRHVLPGVRFAVDAYVNFARRAPWEDAICSSLTELFASSIHRERLEVWPRYYPWLAGDALAYCAKRVKQLPTEADFSLRLTLAHYRSRAEQERALGILQFKLDILWSLLDAVQWHYGPAPSTKTMLAKNPADSCPRLKRGYRLQWEEADEAHVLLYPEGMVQLNPSAAEILRRCDGSHTQAAIIASLQDDFADTSVADDTRAFLKAATENGWLDANA